MHSRPLPLWRSAAIDCINNPIHLLVGDARVAFLLQASLQNCTSTSPKNRSTSRASTKFTIHRGSPLLRRPKRSISQGVIRVSRPLHPFPRLFHSRGYVRCQYVHKANYEVLRAHLDANGGRMGLVYKPYLRGLNRACSEVGEAWADSCLAARLCASVHSESTYGGVER